MTDIDTGESGRDHRFPDGNGTGSPMMESVLAQLATRPAIDMSAVDEARTKLRPADWKLNLNLVLDVTSYTFEVPRSQILGPGRTVPLPHARKGMVWVLCELTDWNLSKIGRLLARDHSTIHTARAEARRLREEDPDFRRLTDAMLQVLEPYCAARVGLEAGHAGCNPHLRRAALGASCPAEPCARATRAACDAA